MPPSRIAGGDPSASAPFNPLEKSELARSVETALLARQPVRLDAVPEFYGAGIYVLYYDGPHPLYAPISGTTTPIYVGKAVPKGARKGQTDEQRARRELWERIREHRESTAFASDLDPSQFAVRYLVADELFIPMAERLMIRTFEPIWNVVIDGFGNHDPGGGRYDQALSMWDALHPGRPWAHRLKPPKILRAAVEQRIALHFANRPAVASEVRLPPLVDLQAGDDHAIDDEVSD